VQLDFLDELPNNHFLEAAVSFAHRHRVNVYCRADGRLKLACLPCVCQVNAQRCAARIDNNTVQPSAKVDTAPSRHTYRRQHQAGIPLGSSPIDVGGELYMLPMQVSEYTFAAIIVWTCWQLLCTACPEVFLGPCGLASQIPEACKPPPAGSISFIRDIRYSVRGRAMVAQPKQAIW
jgi:hypothetical protein